MLQASKILPGSVLHVILSSKYERHVHSHIIESDSPILSHPLPRLLMNELVLELEDVRVIRRDVEVIAPALHRSRRKLLKFELITNNKHAARPSV